MSLDISHKEMVGLKRWNQIVFSSLVAGFLLLTMACIYLMFQEKQVQKVIIASGSATGEAFEFAEAIANIVARHHDQIHVEVMETRGSEENMDRLALGQADLAMTQADVEANASARLVATLYADLFQLVVREDADINSFKDIMGKRLALPKKGGGQWISFWFVAEHYGIKEADFYFETLPTDSAVKAVISGRLDGLFKVRAAPHDAISDIISGCQAKIVPIHQGAAMRLKQPAINTSFIPLGAYRGNPPIPEEDISTVSVDRLLVANQETDPYVVKVITEILFERRRELLQETRLAGFTLPPNRDVGTFIPVHEGANSYYDRDEPSYFVENADFFALILSLGLMLFSAALGLRSMLLNKQKNKADNYTKVLIALTASAKEADDPHKIQQLKNELLDILATVVDALDKDKISPEGFNFFSFTWNVAFSVLREKEQEYMMKSHGSS